MGTSTVCPAPGLLEESPVPADVVLTLEQLDTNHFCYGAGVDP